MGMTPSDRHRFIVSAVMFDLDGTLIDSINVYFKVVETVLKKLALPPVSRKEIHAAVEDGRFNWHRVIPEYLKDEADALVARLIPLAREVYPGIFRREVGFFKGVPKLLAHINGMGVKTAIVTATPSDNMAEKYRLLETQGVAKNIATVVTNDDAPRPKPAPDTLLECCRRLAVNPRQTVYVGDTALDIQAGKAAKAMTAGVLTGFDDRKTLKREHPDIIVEQVTNLSDMVIKFNNID